MKLRNLLALLALLVSPVVGQNCAEPAHSQVESVVSAPAPVSTEASDLLNQLKDRADPNYIVRLKDHSDHDKGPQH